jgi:hypothetical protein
MIKDMRMTIPNARVLATLATGVLVLAGCGSSSTKTTSSSQSPAASVTTSSSATGLPPAVDELAAAQHPRASQFPSAKGRSLQQLGNLVDSSAMLGAATGTFTPGQRRLAFALNTSSGAFIYAPTAIYIAANPRAPAKGPFLAPSDPMSVLSQYRSKENAGPGGIQAIYAARLPIPHKGTFTVLSLTRTAKGLIGAPGEIAVAASSPIPDVGQRPPAIATDTASSVHGKVSLLSTRTPPESMQSASLHQVLGKRPVALLFSTPQFCVSRVCGPVTDIAVQLQHQFGNRVTFIHQEVYVDNQPKLGLRPQLKAFHLRTEPWLFIINRHGVIVDRLEGAFGRNEVASALQAALK